MPWWTALSRFVDKRLAAATGYCFVSSTPWCTNPTHQQQAINLAHASMQHQDLFVVSRDLVNASVNRSPIAYTANPGV